MRCPKCRHQFPANWEVDSAPGEQETPGTFSILGLLFFVPAIACFLFGYMLVAWVLVALAGFVWLQALVAWFDCRDVSCPECKTKVRVWPWSR